MKKRIIRVNVIIILMFSFMSVVFADGNIELSFGSYSNQLFSSTIGGENALLVSSGEVNLIKPTISKSGDEQTEQADFYGTNAGILSLGKLNVEGGEIKTSGSHSNALFAYNTGIINITDTTITTTNNNSGGIMVAGGGEINANNLNVTTSGNSSAAIRSDRGGGKINVTDGTYTSSGMGSPAIYSTADITVKNAKLISNSAEGAVIEGSNSITFDNVNLTDVNNSLNGQSTTYKNIFLYQSMSGDASVGEATFTSKNSNIVTNKGDSFYVTNTSAIINLENNKIVNNDTTGYFLRIQKDSWGNINNNGGKVVLNLTNQKIDGNIDVDNISTLNINMSNNSFFQGKINELNKALSISLKLSKDSILILTGDTYLTSLTNEDTTNSNIYLNNHKLYVNNNLVNANNEEYNEKTNNENTTTSTDDNFIKDLFKIDFTKYLNIFIGIGSIIIVGLFIALIIFINNKKHNRIN